MILPLRNHEGDGDGCDESTECGGTVMEAVFNGFHLTY